MYFSIDLIVHRLYQISQHLVSVFSAKTILCCIHFFQCFISGAEAWLISSRWFYITHNIKQLLLLFIHSVVSDSLGPHGLQHARLPCLSLSPRVFSNSCPLSPWCYLTISSFVALLSSCPQSFPASGTIPVSWLFTSGGQSIGSFSISPSSEYSGLISFRIDCFDLLAVHGTHKILLQHRNLKALVLWYSAFFKVQLSLRYMTAGKTIALIRWTYFGKVMPLYFKYAV